jgi:hypothetical protein
MRLIMNPLLIAVCACLVQGAAASPQQHYVDVSSQGSIRKATTHATSTSSGPMNVTAAMQEKREAYQQHFPFEKMEAERLAKKLRMKERREKAARHFAIMNPNPQQLERVDPEEWEDVEKRQQEQHANHERKLSSWFSNSGGSTSPYSTSVLADPSVDYDMWAQGYRMLGGFIDCDHGTEEDQHSQDNNNDNNDNDTACSRWMMWAAVSLLLNAVTMDVEWLCLCSNLNSCLSSLYLYNILVRQPQLLGLGIQRILRGLCRGKIGLPQPQHRVETARSVPPGILSVYRTDFQAQVGHR